VAFSADGKLLATAGRKVQLWDSFSGREIIDLTMEERRSPFKALAFSSDGRCLAAGAPNGKIYVWDVSGHFLLRALTYTQGPVTALAFSPDSRTLATAVHESTVIKSDHKHEHVGDPEIVLWDLATGKPKTTLSGAGGWFLVSLTYSPDGKTLAAGGTGVVQLWDVSQ